MSTGVISRKNPAVEHTEKAGNYHVDTKKPFAESPSRAIPPFTLIACLKKDGSVAFFPTTTMTPNVDFANGEKKVKNGYCCWTTLVASATAVTTCIILTFIYLKH